MNQRAAQAAQVAQDEVRGRLLSGLRNGTVTLFSFSQKKLIVMLGLNVFRLR